VPATASYVWSSIHPSEPRLSPTPTQVNTRGELLLIDTATSAVRVVDFSDQEDGVADVAWSPCGCWVAYQVREDRWHRLRPSSSPRLPVVIFGTAWAQGPRDRIRA
jgi:hypothetical protein